MPAMFISYLLEDYTLICNYTNRKQTDTKSQMVVSDTIRLFIIQVHHSDCRRQLILDSQLHSYTTGM